MQTSLTSQFLASSCIQVSLIHMSKKKGIPHPGRRLRLLAPVSLLSPELIPLISCSVTVPNSTICSQLLDFRLGCLQDCFYLRSRIRLLPCGRRGASALALAFWLLLKSQIENSRERYGIKPRFYISVVSVGVHLVVNHSCLSLVFNLGINYQNYTNAVEL
jgi:hypothetical protein